MANQSKEQTDEAAGCPSCGCSHENGSGEGVSGGRIASVVVSGVLTGAGLFLGWAQTGGEKLANLLFLAAIGSGIWLLLPGAWASLRRILPDMNLLMLVAVAGAVGIGEWAEAAAVVFLFSLSELLEAYATRRSDRALRSLLELSPETALVAGAEGPVEVPTGEVGIGTRVLVRSGQRIPLDGKVIAGGSSVNQAPITGESLPVEKRVGDGVFAGTINGEGRLEIEVTKAAGDSTLARIVRLVEEARVQRTGAERFVDRFARYYTPLVVVAAVLVATLPPLLAGAPWALWFYRALILLVIACPCALVIATPVAVVTALTSLARRGVLVKGGVFLETLGRLRALAMDKTGTITEGRPRVLGVEVVAAADAEEVLRVAAALDAHSAHPMAKAVVAAAREKCIQIPDIKDYGAASGRGVEGMIDGHRFFVGNHRFTHELGVCSPELEERLERMEARAQSVVVVGHAPHDGCLGGVIGVLAVGDGLRPRAREAVEALRRAGVGRVIMLSGDNQRTVSVVAARAGIDEAHGDLLPEDKLAAVKKLVEEHEVVGMVGDGVNDAPALAVASVGIAMGAAGTDTAIETADVALMKDDLLKLAEAIHLGRRSLGIIRFNIVFALGTKAVFLALAVLGYTSLWLAILADTGTTLLVIMNALRLLRVDHRP